jgi:5-formyltetrahydrofolate cyclo-ligase
MNFNPSSQSEYASRQSIRKNIRAKRNALSDTFRRSNDRLLFNKLTTHSKISSAKNIALYLSNDGELDLQLFVHWCWQNKKNVYLPVVHPFSKGQLLFLNYQPDTLMKISNLGIREPKLDVRIIKLASEMDIILTPLVAFDTAGNRLGMGGGFYDRTFAACLQPSGNNSTNPPYPVGIAHDCQQVEQLPIEHWDIPLPEIITPSQNIINRCKR